MSEEAGDEEEEVHKATDAHASSDAYIEISIPQKDLAHIELDLPVMAVLLADAGDEALNATLTVIRQLLLTPSAPHCSVVSLAQLSRMACPEPHAARFPAAATTAVLLNQTFRHARLEYVPGAEGDLLRTAGLALEPLCISSVFNWNSALLQSFGRLMFVRRLHSHALLGTPLSDRVSALAVGDMTARETHLALMWLVGVPGTAAQVPEWRRAVRLVLARGWSPSAPMSGQVTVCSGVQQEAAVEASLPDSMEEGAVAAVEEGEMEEVEGVVLTNVNDDLSVFKVTRVPGYGPELAARGDVVIPSNVLCWPVACLRWRASLSLSVSLSVSVCRWLSVSLAVCLSVCQSVSQ